MKDLPVAVVGAGPVGLAAAAHLDRRGHDFVVLEAGDRPAEGVRAWGHVQLFSPWSQLIDPVAAQRLDGTGWTSPPSGVHPTGAEWVEQYLQPLAQTFGERLRLGRRVSAISRRGRDLMADRGREDEPFVVVHHGPGGQERLLASAVIDASGTTSTPSPVGADGIPAIGEDTHRDRLHAGVPDLSDVSVRSRHAGRHTAVVGAGHTAMNAVVALQRLALEEPGTTVSWILRSPVDVDTFGGGNDDQLQARGALGQAAAAAAATAEVHVVSGFRVQQVSGDGTDVAGRLTLHAEDGRTVEAVDTVVVATGYRPDLGLESEVRVDLDPAVQAPRKLAPLIDPNIHSCGTVPPHGIAELAHPEPRLFLAGMKSYGRAPTFLALTGYEQVRSIVASLVGDDEAANRVELTLPETGVCSGSGLTDVDQVDCVLPGGDTATVGRGPNTASRDSRTGTSSATTGHEDATWPTPSRRSPTSTTCAS